MTQAALAITSVAVAASFLCGMMVQSARSSEADAKKDVRVTGIGGIFFKAHDAPKLAAWYREHLGIVSEGGFHTFEWLEKDEPSKTGSTTWAIFPEASKYFGASKSPLMINYRVANLDYVLAQLRKEGVQVDEKVQDESYGKFGWATDPEGNRFELWESK